MLQVGLKPKRYLRKWGKKYQKEASWEIITKSVVNQMTSRTTNLRTSLAPQREIDKTMEYPNAHPKAEEIRLLKEQIEDLYKRLKAKEESSRESFKQAMDSLKAMGADHKFVHELIATLAVRIKELQALVESPLI